MSKKKDKEELANIFIANQCVEFAVEGRTALFADPVFSVGGEKNTYSVPTYEAIKGLLKRIYWKPTFVWVVDKVRVMNPIQTESVGTKLPNINNGSNDLAYYTYLTNVKYQVQAHLEWNENRKEYAQDRDIRKHYSIFAKELLRGGKLPVFLGKSECVGDVWYEKFSEGKGAYDEVNQLNFGWMYHGLTYADEQTQEDYQGLLTIESGNVVMRNGVIEFKKPEECTHQIVRRQDMKKFVDRGDTQ